ncbi:MAG: nucleoside-diphosphate kinase [Parcubacteria group bacterium]|nr:nucleoside-diphosphate kinase [Parcubacteria group bacterium]
MNHPKKEKTFVLLKPDAVERSLVGEVIRRIERTGLKLVALKVMLATREQAVKHYNKDDKWCEEKGARTVKNLELAGKTPEKPAIEYGRDIVNGLADFMTCGPVVAMVWQGNAAAGIVKKLVGGTEPLTSDVGTIRGDFTIDSYDMANVDARAVRNLIHCSDTPEEASREMQIWFKDDEILNYRLINEEILYDVNLDGILE